MTGLYHRADEHEKTGGSSSRSGILKCPFSAHAALIANLPTRKVNRTTALGYAVFGYGDWGRKSNEEPALRSTSSSFPPASCDGLNATIAP